MSPPNLFGGKRIDFKKIKTDFGKLSQRAQKSTDIYQFVELVQPFIIATIKSHMHLLSEENYVEGEFASLVLFTVECVNNLIPSHIPYLASEVNDDGELLFVKKPTLN